MYWPGCGETCLPSRTMYLWAAPFPSGGHNFLLYIGGGGCVCREGTTNTTSSTKIPSIVGSKIKDQKLPLGNLQASCGYKAHKQNMKTNTKQCISKNQMPPGTVWGGCVLCVYNKGDIPATSWSLPFS